MSIETGEFRKKIKRKKWKRRIIIISILVIVVGIILWSYIKMKKGQELVFDTKKVDRGDIKTVVSTTGNLSPVTTVDVGSQVSGTIWEVYVDYNTRVRQGQILAKIDPSLFETKLEKAKANLNSAIYQEEVIRANLDNAKIQVQQAQADIYNAQAEVNRAKANLENAKGRYLVAKASLKKAEAQLMNDKAEYERAKKLFADDLISMSERDKAFTKYQISKAALESERANVRSSYANIKAAKSTLSSALSQLQAAITRRESAVAKVTAEEARLAQAQASIQQARSDVETARVNLDRCIIRSPIDGIVIDKKIEPGQTVAASFQTPVLFVLAKNLKLMEVKASVDEADIGKVKERQKVEFNVDAFPEDTFTGSVFQVRSSPKMEQNVVTYEVIIRTENKDLKLKPGMTANINITVDVKKNVLRVPNAALRFKPSRYKNFPYPKQSPSKGEKEKKADPNSAVVWVLENGKPKPIKITIGVSNSQYTEVKSGNLKEGMDVIVDAQTRAQRKAKKKKRGELRV